MAIPAISIAAYSLDPAALRRELARGVAVDLEDPDGMTALQLVCGRGPRYQNQEDRIACVEMLLEHGAAPNAGLPHNPGHLGLYHSKTPLMYAAHIPCPRTVQMLIAAGSDVNGYLPERQYPVLGHLSPLLNAVRASFRFDEANGLDVVNLLLKAGADPNPPEHCGRTLMEEAIEMALHGFWADRFTDRRRVAARPAERRLWPVLLRAGAILPTRLPWASPQYQMKLSDHYLLRVENAGGFKAYERAHREKVLATFTPKFAHLVPEELVPLIVEYVFHFGFY